MISLMTHRACNIETNLSFRRTIKSKSEHFNTAVLATHQVLNTNTWLVVIIPDHGNLEHLIHCRKFCWTVLK